MTSHAAEAFGYITPVTSATMTMRNFRDDAGRIWTVFEVQPTGRPELLPEVYRAGWLAFEHPSENRRFAPPPKGWEAYGERELALLLAWSTKV